MAASSTQGLGTASSSRYFAEAEMATPTSQTVLDEIAGMKYVAVINRLNTQLPTLCSSKPAPVSEIPLPPTQPTLIQHQTVYIHDRGRHPLDSDSDEDCRIM